jgi:hypothetical protein
MTRMNKWLLQISLMQRQTNVVVNNAPIRFPAISIKATLETIFNIPVERTIQSTKRGRF